jgi:uncharacterized protein (DUF58 family)
MFRSLYLTRFFFLACSCGIALMIAAYVFPYLLFYGKMTVYIVLGTTLLDIILVNIIRKPISYQRTYAERMNLGDENIITVEIINQTLQPLNVAIYEGYPTEMQMRERFWNRLLLPRSKQTITYVFKPTERGLYPFNEAVVFIRSTLFLVQRRVSFPTSSGARVYPSVLQMKQMELKVFNPQTQSLGIKKVRRLGNTSEFEQIKNYVQGDDVRNVNWKATSRKNELMVNQYQDEKSQPVYCLIDKSRPMQLAFEGMNMLDYAINSSLVFSNIALRKGDRAGLFTFSDKIGTIIPADKSAGQLGRILEGLYNQKTHFKESNYELLYQTIRTQIKTRSLLFLFTNFESEFAMRRALPMLQRLNKRHVLIVIFFQNNELELLSQQPVSSNKDLIQATIAEKMGGVKWALARELKQFGIQSILTRPEDLSINTINKYLELKAKGVI